MCCRWLLIGCCFCFFFFKQKTAYEMRISDWSSDVCSSDLDDTLEPTASITWDWVARSAGCACQVRGASPAGNPALPDASTMIMMPPINPAAKMAEANGSRRREFRRALRGGRWGGGGKASSLFRAWDRGATTNTAHPSTHPP